MDTIKLPAEPVIQNLRELADELEAGTATIASGRASPEHWGVVLNFEPRAVDEGADGVPWPVEITFQRNIPYELRGMVGGGPDKVFNISGPCKADDA